MMISMERDVIEYLPKWVGVAYILVTIYGLELKKSRWSRGFCSTWSTVGTLKSRISELSGKLCYKRYTTQACVLVCIFRLLWISRRMGGGRKHQYQCGWGNWRKLPTIVWICRGTSECVGWSTTIIFTSRESKMDQTKYTTKKQDHESMDSKMLILLSRVYAFCEKERHAIMDCLFVPFHIKTNIARHVEIQNVTRTLMY